MGLLVVGAVACALVGLVSFASGDVETGLIMLFAVAIAVLLIHQAGKKPRR